MMREINPGSRAEGGGSSTTPRTESQMAVEHQVGGGEDVVLGEARGDPKAPGSSPFAFSFPTQPPPAATFPPDMRRPCPGDMPNFPGATDHRSPQRPVPFSPSPTLAIQHPIPALSTPTLGIASPWHALAAGSGAPTPSIDGPMGKSSPHLGYPFEKLNIGDRWSGGSLPAEGSSRIPSTSLPGYQSVSVTSPSPASAAGSDTGPARGLSMETLMRYRAMAAGAGAGTNRASETPPSSFPPKSLSAPIARHATSPSPLAHPTAATTKCNPMAPSHLTQYLSSSSTLILDVRPPSSFYSSHIPSSHSLPIPSTLLRRPAFTLAKLVQMLTPDSTEAVARWPEKRDIILLDTDSATVPEGGALDGLASKFMREGYAGNLWFVKGGHAAVEHNKSAPLVSHDSDDESAPDAPALTAGKKGLAGGRLASLAFSHESTSGGGKSRRQAPPKGLQIPQTPSLNLHLNPFGPNVPINSAATERPAFQHPRAPSTTTDAPRPKLQPANPFFDNIRQNLELSHGGITERIPLNLPDDVRDKADRFPDWLRALVTMPEKDSMDELAKQFYQLELHEQKRLQAVMQWHAKGSGGVVHEGMAYGDAPPAGQAVKKGWGWAVQTQADVEELQRLMECDDDVEQDDYFPFSITAGVERGTKNRYKNIWPYDFSRVRLGSPPDKDSDYINASFVQPRGTSRRYIATQGPLDATYRDFWTLVWEQNVRVIVMITKQYEGGLLKCGNYWGQETYGPVTLKLVSESGGEDKAQPSATAGFDFGMPNATPQAAPTADNNTKQDSIKRVFTLSRADRPHEPARQIVQIQCVGWPDFDVPETPDILLNLIKDVNDATKQVHLDNETRSGDEPPVLVHCSAGVGRTGSFIVVDAILDGLHRDIRAGKAHSKSLSEGPRVPDVVPPQHSYSAPATSSSSESETPSSSLAVSPDLRSLSGSTNTVHYTASPGTMAAEDGDGPGGVSDLVLGAHRDDGKMQVDAKTDTYDQRYMQYRGSSGGQSVSSVNTDRRPSLTSARTSSERLSAESIHKALGGAQPTTRQNQRYREPSSLSEMDNPVSCVLEGMRVQRMSLVQTLRQYLFVHRAIICYYMKMLDEDKDAKENSERPSPVPVQPSHSTSGAVHSFGSGSGGSGNSLPTVGSHMSLQTSGSSGSVPTLASGMSIQTAASGSLSDPASAGFGGSLGSVRSLSFISPGAGTDDEANSKRRASPTELHPDVTLAGDTKSGLTKRASFKKMKSAVESITSGRAAGTSSGYNGVDQEALNDRPIEDKKV